MKRICPHPPTPSPKSGRRGARISNSLPNLGEGFRERAKTTVLNLNEVHINFGFCIPMFLRNTG